ncbi:MAG: hypothetical protein KGL13_05130 [Gammaproteobacteria bacterium]|nr:hypothetical protein [Gammaproteobacteria bacterium]MDE2345831.1 hypothetical protein [Gammaproteobacteria bacterium]
MVLQVVPGPWTGTYNLSGGSNEQVTGVVSSSGFGYFADKNGYVFLIENVPQQSPFTGTAIGTAPAAQVFPDGSNVDTFIVNGTYSSTTTATQMQASLTGIDPNSYTTYAGYTLTGVNGNFTLNSAVTYNGVPTIAALQGLWNGYYIGSSSTSVDITVNPDATFNGNDGNGCTISGSLVQQDPGTNLYYVNYKASGTGCPGYMNGLAYVSTKDVSGDFSNAAGTYLYMGIFGPSIAYSVELKM